MCYSLLCFLWVIKINSGVIRIVSEVVKIITDNIRTITDNILTITDFILIISNFIKIISNFGEIKRWIIGMSGLNNSFIWRNILGKCKSEEKKKDATPEKAHRILKKWSCRDSNPGPNKRNRSFLHAYSILNCQKKAVDRHAFL